MYIQNAIKYQLNSSSTRIVYSFCRNLSRDSNRVSSAQATQSIYVDKEWENALPFEKIPGPKVWDFVKGFMPGGKYRNLDMVQLSKQFNDKYGGIWRIPGIFDRPNFVIVNDPDDFAKILRTEGSWPVRKGNETMHYYRNKVRPELFKEYGGLLTE